MCLAGGLLSKYTDSRALEGYVIILNSLGRLSKDQPAMSVSGLRMIQHDNEALIASLRIQEIIILETSSFH